MALGAGVAAVTRSDAPAGTWTATVMHALASPLLLECLATLGRAERRDH